VADGARKHELEPGSAVVLRLEPDTDLVALRGRRVSHVDAPPERAHRLDARF